jgi:hypothetical protein
MSKNKYVDSGSPCLSPPREDSNNDDVEPLIRNDKHEVDTKLIIHLTTSREEPK